MSEDESSSNIDQLMNLEKLKNITPNDIAKLKPDEQIVVKQIVSELASGGSSQTLKDLWYSDYEEVPVDIDTFIDDPRYLGSSLSGSIYPFWRKKLKELFAPGALFNECLTGDTEIPLLDGTTDTLASIHERLQSGEKIETYSLDKSTNDIVPGYIIKSKLQGKRTVYKITLSNGHSIKATGNHKFMLDDKSDILVKDLKVGDSLMPFRRAYSEDNPNYEMVLKPEKNHSSRWVLTHQEMGKWKNGALYKNLVRSRTSSTNFHHKNGNTHDNRPENLAHLTTKMHLSYHRKHLDNAAMRGESWALNELEKRRLKASAKRWSDPNQRIKSSIRRRLINEGWNDKVLRDKKINQLMNNQEYLNTHYGIDFVGRGASSSSNKKQKMKLDETEENEKFSGFDSKRDDSYKGIIFENPKPWFYKNKLPFSTVMKLIKLSWDYQSLLKMTSLTKNSFKRLYKIDDPEKYMTPLPSDKLMHSGKKFVSYVRAFNRWKRVKYDSEQVPDLLKELEVPLDALRKTSIRIDHVYKIQKQSHDFQKEIRSSKVQELLYHQNPVLVTSIEKLSQKENVYDITVDKCHTFASCAGIFICNCLLTGGIGLGKSTIADIGLAYILYKLLCLKNPQEYYGLNSTATIAVAFFNITLSQSYGVAYGKMQDMLKMSPWFLDHGNLVGNQNLQYVPGKGIELIVG